MNVIRDLSTVLFKAALWCPLQTRHEIAAILALHSEAIEKAGQATLKMCEWCLTAFDIQAKQKGAKRATRKFCCDACRVAAYRQRKERMQAWLATLKEPRP